MVKFITDKKEKEQIATLILNQLPEWFGLPESTKEYILNSKEMPFWAYIEEEPIGFIVLKETSKYTAEIYVMGVLKENHQQGIGTALFQKFQDYAKENGYEDQTHYSIENNRVGFAFAFVNVFFRLRRPEFG